MGEDYDKENVLSRGNSMSKGHRNRKAMLYDIGQACGVCIYNRNGAFVT